MKKVIFLLGLAFVFLVVSSASGQTAKKPYELIQWNKPKPISQRISGEQYVLPDGWKEAVKGVSVIKVSNFGALEHDPVSSSNRFAF